MNAGIRAAIAAIADDAWTAIRDPRAIWDDQLAGDGVVAGLERGEAAADLVQVREVVGGEDFALDHGEDFRLVQP